jgi:hypothetical protein
MLGRETGVTGRVGIAEVFFSKKFEPRPPVNQSIKGNKAESGLGDSIWNGALSKDPAD